MSMTRRMILALGAVMLVGMVLPVAWAQDGQPTETPVATAPPEDTTPVPVARPAVVDTITQDGVTVETFYETIKQGRAGLVRVYGDDVVGASARFRERPITFFPADDGYYGLLAIDMELAARDFEAEVFAELSDGSLVTVVVPVSVDLGGFVRRTFELPPDRVFLANQDVERAEFARLDAVFATVTEQQYWDASGFRLPINAELTSVFGELRLMNATMETRHTGWDLRAATGQPVMASAGGRVAFAGMMDIRGNHVIIDHGYGIFSGYSHFSVVHVTRGQDVTHGQIIGMSGNTGRSSGPHLHWELNVNGEWVDSVDFINMWLPNPPIGD